MQNTWLVLLPTIILLVMAVVTKDVIKSLMTGILAAALVVSDFNIINTIKLASYRLFEQTEILNVINRTGHYDNLYTFAFLIILGIIITIITHTGAMAAYTCAIQKRIKTIKSTETASLMLSSCFFMDDYLNTLTVGSIMRPLTDAFKIARVKLAFLLDSMSSALALLIPASSWTAIILSQLQSVNIEDTLGVYLKTIPYIFYAWFIIFSAVFVVRASLSFGKMKQHEDIALQTGNLFGNKPTLEATSYTTPKECSLIDFFIPISLFMFSVITAFLYTGSWRIFGGSNSFLQSLQKGDPFIALFSASALTLIVSIIYFAAKKKLNFEELKYVSVHGFNLMKSSIVLLLLAKTMSVLLKSDLQTGQYLASILIGSVPIWVFPLIFFIASSLVAMSTGSSWGTIGIMIPIAIPTIAQFSAALFNPVLGGVLSGSVAGAHLSPISDPMLISSTSSGSYHLDHVQTQMSYASSAMIGASVSYIVCGLVLQLPYWINIIVSWLTGIFVTTALLYLRNRIKK
ncbi:hypothetical protein M1446_00980 [Candidatus Dependentiae bacterium]|nr:hypothetical protein [Candidatus Dependentiae bacterium]